MINRGVTKTSQYFFNTETSMLEKIDDNVQTIESLSKQANGQVNHIEDITEKVNNKNKNEPMNNIVVITADDNLIHNYFYDIDISWDASNCLSTAIIKMPKMNSENVGYWATYTGQLTIYAGYNFTFDYVNNNSNKLEQDAVNSISKYWDNSDITPFFRGEISRIKEFENDITIYVDSIGRRFQQKIPDEFRQSYINNQNVRDAFQAICEFLGVFFICPPKTVVDNGETNTENTETTTNGTENNIDKQQQTENQIKNIVKDKTEGSALDGVNTNNTENNKTTDTNNNTNNSINNPELTDNKEIDVPQNGYADINFDANGAITHGQQVIETSPDMAQTLLKMDENPLEKYLEDETGVIEYVKKFLDGDMFEELHNNVMNYDAITIEPKTTTTSDMSSVGGVGGASGDSTTNENNGEEGSSRDGNVSASFGNTSSRARERNGWINGQYYINGKIYLSKEYLNSLSPSEAWDKYINGQGVYTDATLTKLRARGYWQPIV